MTVASPKWSTVGLVIQEMQQIKMYGIPTKSGSAIIEGMRDKVALAVPMVLTFLASGPSQPGNERRRYTRV